MKKLVIALFFVSAIGGAQKVKVLKGNFKNLSPITEYNMTFDYSDLKIDKFKNEEDFLADKMKKRDEKGTAEDFKKSWFSDRAERYEPKFIESFTKRFDGKVKAERNMTSAKYTMNVKTTFIHPGYNVGVSRSSSKIDAIITVFEKANPSNILFEGSFEGAKGSGAMGYDFNSGYRISESYAKLAKTLASKIK